MSLHYLHWAGIATALHCGEAAPSRAVLTFCSGYAAGLMFMQRGGIAADRRDAVNGEAQPRRNEEWQAAGTFDQVTNEDLGLVNEK